MTQAFQKIKDRDATRYKIFGVTIYKKEKFLSSKAYYFLGFLYFKKRIRPDRETTYFLGIKVKDKKKNLIPTILPHAKGKEFIYFCYHSGDFYYLCSFIKQNFEIFKDMVIMVNFAYLKQVLELFDFDKQWIEEHFVLVPSLWYFSTGYWCDKNGQIISKVELDHEKGWIVNAKSAIKLNKYETIQEVISSFLSTTSTQTPSVNSSCSNVSSSILLLPESQFNGNLDKIYLKKLVEELVHFGYHVLINTKNNVYDDLLNNNVEKIFLSYKETFNLASNCKAIIGVRSGLLDCLQSLVDVGVKFFIIYQNQHYPQYKFFKNFKKWFMEVYSFNNINKTNSFNEYIEFTNLTTNEILKKLKGY